MVLLKGSLSLCSILRCQLVALLDQPGTQQGQSSATLHHLTLHKSHRNSFIYRED